MPALACQEAGYDNGSSEIGDESCNGEGACYQAGFDGGDSVVGERSCNQSGAYDRACNSAHPDVGDCEFNSPKLKACEAAETPDFLNRGGRFIGGGLFSNIDAAAQNRARANADGAAAAAATPAAASAPIRPPSTGDGGLLGRLKRGSGDTRRRH